MRVEKFRIAVPDAELADLRDRLARVRWPDQLDGVGWDWGTDLTYLRALVAYWRDSFDWRAREAELNRLPQFMAELDDHRIHFVHQRGQGPAPLPLVVTHGWPGSFVEMTKILPLLTDPGSHGGDPSDAFDVVVPSLPGYGFSSRPGRPGTNVFAIAGLWSRLMTGLGYSRFGAQGGDWGASVTTCLGKLFPGALAGIHLNFIPGSYQPPLGDGEILSDAEKDFVARRAVWLDQEGGYGHIQGTKPQTLAYGLADSPVGLAAWIVEKFRSWADCGGDVERVFSKDELLTNIAVYWFTQTIGSSLRLYREGRAAPLRFAPGERVAVPVGVAHLPHEIPMPPRRWVERVYDVVRWTELPRGGHFAALEQPELLAQDIRAFFRPLRG
jgi:pimeloyl-ACP methyl ester carboxylesterase